jgi:O-methyltransferase involved in polyketide biosynthesis
VRRLGAIPSHVTLVPLDLATDMLDTTMSAGRYRSDVRTFFICEGVTHYLSASAVETLLRFVAHSAGGSRIVFTYIHRRDRYLTPLGRGREPLSEFQRAALAEITDGRRSGRA